MENIKKLWEKQTKQKQITLTLEEGIVTKIDTISKALGAVLPGKPSRGDVVKLALNHYYEIFRTAFIEDHEYDPESIEENILPVKIAEDFDLVIFPAQHEGYQKAFLNENKWYYVRINEKKIPKVKYIACYVGTPISGITHYAEVAKIEKATGEYSGKYIIHFKSSPIELPKTIFLGELNVWAMKSPRYTTLDQLLKIDTLDKIF